MSAGTSHDVELGRDEFTDRASEFEEFLRWKESRKSVRAPAAGTPPSVPDGNPGDSVI